MTKSTAEVNGTSGRLRQYEREIPPPGSGLKSDE